MIGTLILSVMVSALIGASILLVGTNSDRVTAKVATALAISWTAASILMALTSSGVDEIFLFWLPMLAVGTAVTTILVHKLWTEREAKRWKGTPWWKEENRVK